MNEYIMAALKEARKELEWSAEILKGKEMWKDESAMFAGTASLLSHIESGERPTLIRHAHYGCNRVFDERVMQDNENCPYCEGTWLGDTVRINDLSADERMLNELYRQYGRWQFLDDANIADTKAQRKACFQEIGYLYDMIDAEIEYEDEEGETE